MPITYLDEPKSKSRITYLDDASSQQPKSKGFFNDLGQETFKQANQFAYGFGNEALLGAYDAAKRGGFNIDPGKPENLMQGASRVIGQGTGFVTGMPGKIGRKFVQEVTPMAGKIAKPAIEFGVGRAASAPTRIATGESTPSEEAMGIAGATALGGAIPIAGKAIKSIKNAPTRLSNKLLRGGASAQDAKRISQQYGTSNSSLVDSVKQKLSDNVKLAEENFSKVIDEIPLSKRTRLNNFRKELTDSLQGMFRGGKLRTDIPREDVSAIKELVDMYKDPRQVFDKTEFLRRRSRLSDLQQSPNGELATKASKLKEALEQDAEDFGFGNLKEVKNQYRIAKQKQSQFMNRNTGDLKVATEAKLNRIGTDKGLSGQEKSHIDELGEYTGVPISDEARAINRLTQQAQRWKAIKKGAAIGALGLSGLGGAKNLFFH